MEIVICHLSFVIRHSSFVICHLSFVIYHLSYSLSREASYNYSHCSVKVLSWFNFTRSRNFFHYTL
ncbi:hypothetical protein [Coleofasciculus sp. F4-SAH-05]|uniref:hypothetical protein n=1 Tax=Coleofasciculus sp. F4-SAH-05 TaxID=3069525 RepID=UPI0032F7C4AE